MSKNAKYQWLQLLVSLGILIIMIHWYKWMFRPAMSEGFHQDSRFVMKRNSDIYDDFYVQIYDQVLKPQLRISFEADQIIKMTQPTKESVFLDVGSGTGILTNHFHQAGYHIHGIDKSAAMVHHADRQFPDAIMKCGDIADPMAFDRNTFSHILCMGMTIYEIPDKVDFFHNCYYWLKPNGFLILHLVDREKFDTIVPVGKPDSLKSPQMFAQKRITNTMVDFMDFKYKASYDFQDAKNRATMTETFTDNASGNIRQNELTLHMEKMEDILYTARYCGFIAHGQANYLECNGDEHQYLVILERPH